MLIEFAPLIFGTAGLLAIFLFSHWKSTSKQKAARRRLHNSSLMFVAQAAISAGFDFRR